MTAGLALALAAMVCFGLGDWTYRRAARAGVRPHHFLIGQACLFCPTVLAYAAATVPKITVIMRKAYGGAYLAMCSKDMGADYVYAWPSAEIAVMGAEGAARVVYKKEIESAADPKAKEAELVKLYREKFASPYQAAENNMITDVIEPSETRFKVSLALRYALTKRVTRPPKKHGLIPL